ncbi:bifunctional DNA-formamidopyrimidine glycosylase/DNA-(apurinic or apyrimidinic site) lyase [Devosia sp. ZB163]|uniref:bifunctional DNA-formamidopyrimidine glycosylase/DNA-(apurinic or apyrimidinic site) lyase n=1 Tax=Devosia sp. ZB163 TaxID=3025938 RepID=UPI00235F6D9D|nr:bifunctional DNA-formamidopyrimidine glycosylase/DNA-(apurinic or apyrimidinic site) lyase [Devosia sp. ZB163]MDC9822688.1 bifunctional DNA-formamidopyrimidine glycosylase/DNA-(apurinic or apyrimidinic site) lyase [Devosia sp. ZB163]
MPELPEVETVRRGLEPYVTGARIDKVVLKRKDLRFPFPEGFGPALEGATIEATGRRAKYLLFRLSTGKTWLSHLGMTGTYRFEDFKYKDPSRYYEPTEDRKHDHLVLELTHPEHGTMKLIYNDARRFGFMDMFEDEEQSPWLAELGPEPLSNAFNAAEMADRFRGKKAPMKAALLDQRVVAGLGNIYVSEALHRAHIRPDIAAGTLVLKSGKPSKRLENLADGVRTVLVEAIDAGGSTLRDFRAADGNSGYFQHRFAVYDRENEPCPTPGCRGTIKRIVQSGRSTFFCPICQH